MLEAQINVLSKELQLWREGKSVEAEQWVLLSDKIGKDVPESDSAVTLIQNEADNLTKDLSAEFLERENELEDQIAAKEKELNTKQSLLDTVNEELSLLKQKEVALTSTNIDLTFELSELKVKLEQVDFENKEANIVIDSLKDTKEVLETQYQLLQVIFALN